MRTHENAGCESKSLHYDLKSPYKLVMDMEKGVSRAHNHFLGTAFQRVEAEKRVQEENKMH